MKKLGLLFFGFALLSFSFWSQPLAAQCTPTATGNVAGLYPTPIPSGCVGQPYSEVVDFVFPLDTTVTIPLPPFTLTVPFDSFEVVSINNVPSGITFVLNASNNKYYPASATVSARGCADINGTPLMATLVTDSVDISFRGWLTVPIVGSTSAVSLIRQQLEILPSPTAGFTSGLPAGNTIPFTDGSSGATTWAWDFGDGGTSTLQSPNHTYAGPGNYLVCQIVSNGNCSDTTCSVVTLGCPAPAVVWNSAITGTTVDFTDMTLGNPQSWFWDFGDGNTNTTQNPSHTYTAAGTYTVCLTVTDSCGTDSTCMSVTACDLPEAIFTFSADDEDVDFTGLSTNATTYAWDFGDGGTSTQQDPSHTYPGTGTYTVCLIATSACGADTSCQTVSICLPPEADFSFVTTTVFADFTDISTTTGSVTYAWDFGDGNTSTMQSPSHTYSAVGTYLVCLTVTDSCSADTICQTVDIATSIDPSLLSSLQLFPNPNSGSFVLQGVLEQNEAVGISVVDILGRSVYAQQGERMTGTFRREIDLGNVTPGLYFVKVEVANQISVMKIRVERK